MPAASRWSLVLLVIVASTTTTTVVAQSGAGGGVTATLVMDDAVPTTTLAPTTPAPPNIAGQHVEVLSVIESASINGQADREDRRVVISCAKSSALRWSSTGCRTPNAIYMRSGLSYDRGFNARYPNLFNPATVSCTATELFLYLSFDPFYKVPPGGDSIQVFLAPVVAIGGALPWNVSDESARVTFAIDESKPYVSRLPSSVWWPAEVTSTVVLLPLAIFLRRPTLAALLPRIQFFRSLAVCEFALKYNLGRIQYPLQLPFGESAYQYFIPVSPLNMALFAFIVASDCLVLFLWTRFAARNQWRNVELLPPGIREHAKSKVEAGESLAVAGGHAVDERPELKDSDFFVLKTLASADTAVARSMLTAGDDEVAGGGDGSVAMSAKKRKRLEKEAEEKLERTVGKRKKERLLSDDGGVDDEGSPRRPKNDAKDPEEPEDPPLPDDEDAKRAAEEEKAEEARLKEEERLANRTPDEVDRDLAAAESNPFAKLRIHARRVKRAATSFIGSHFSILLVFLRFLGAGRLPSPWWWLLFLWAQPVVQSVLVVVWNLEDSIVIQALLSFSLVPWAFFLIWIVRVLLIGFPMRFWDEDRRLIDDETRMREERAAEALEQAKRNKEALEACTAKVAARRSTLRAERSEKRAEERLKAKEETEKKSKADDAIGKAGDGKAKGSDDDKPSSSVRSGSRAPSVASDTAAPSPMEDADKEAKDKATDSKPTKDDAAAKKDDDDPSDSDSDTTYGDDSELLKLQRELREEEAAAEDAERGLHDRQFPRKPLFYEMVAGYGRWITTYTPPSKLDIDTKRKERRMEELHAEREAWQAKMEREREAHKKKLDEQLKEAEAKKTDEEKAEEESLMKGDGEDGDAEANAEAKQNERTMDGGGGGEDDDGSDADSVITHISDSQHRGKAAYTLCQALDGPSLPDPDDAKVCAEFARTYDDLYGMYRPFRHWFAVVELVVSICFGILESVRTTQGCVIIAGPALGLSLVYLVLLAVLRPAIAPIDNVFFIAVAGMQVWASVFFFAFSFESDLTELELTGSAAIVATEFAMVFYLLVQLFKAAEPLAGWVEANKRAWFTRYPWLRESVLADPIGHAAAAITSLRAEVRDQLDALKKAQAAAAEKAKADRRERREARKRREALLAKGLPPSDEDDDEQAGKGRAGGLGAGLLSKSGAAPANRHEDSEDEISVLAGAAPLLRRPPCHEPQPSSVGATQHDRDRDTIASGDSYTTYTSATSFEGEDFSTLSYVPPHVLASVNGDGRAGVNEPGVASTFIDSASTGGCSDSQCTECKHAAAASATCSCGRSSHHRDSSSSEGSSLVSSSVETSSLSESAAGSDCSCATLQFQDEGGNLLSLKDVAGLLRDWQRRHYMPNVGADMLPLPLDELRNMVRASGVDDAREDEAVLALVSELQANATAGQGVDRTTAAMAALEAGAPVDPSKEKPDAARPANKAPPAPPAPQLHDAEAVEKFEGFFGRRPKACCTVM